MGPPRPMVTVIETGIEFARLPLNPFCRTVSTVAAGKLALLLIFASWNFGAGNRRSTNETRLVNVAAGAIGKWSQPHDRHY